MMKQNSCLQEFASYVFANVAGMVGISCYILADTYFIAQGVGANGLTALNLALPVYSLIHGCGLMLGMGGATRYAIFQGQKVQKKANDVFTNMIYGAAGLSCLFLLAGLLLSVPITRLLQANEEVFSMTNVYLKVILLFSPAFIMNDILNCFVRNDGSPKLAMVAMLTGSLANIGMDYLFIFPLEMGIFGAVLATGCSPLVGMMILSLHWLGKRNQAKLEPVGFSMETSRSAWMLGVPSLISEVASGIVMIVFNTILLGLQGNVGVAAYGVVANLSLVVISIYTGIGQGMQPIISRAFGVADWTCIRKTLGYAMWTMLAISVIIYVGLFVLANPVVALFNSEGNLRLQEMAVQGIRLYFLANPFVGFNVVMAIYFASTAKALPAQLITVMRGIVVIIPMAFLLAKLARIAGVYLTFPATEGIVAALAFVLYLRYHYACTSKPVH